MDSLVTRDYRVNFSAVVIPDLAHTYVQNVLDVGRPTSGAYVQEFEEALAAMVGSKHAIAVSSGTMADMIALKAMHIHTGACKVITPALTFEAQPSAVLAAGLVLVFRDVDYERWTLKKRKTGYAPDGQLQTEEIGDDCIVFPSNIMGRIASEFHDHPRLVEDACESFGSRLDGRWAGTFGKIGTYSFFASHTITCGEGGAIVTSSDELAGLCRALRNHGREGTKLPYDKFAHEYSGFNGKMSNLTAALACAVLSEAPKMIARRRENFERMDEMLGGQFVEEEGEVIVPHGYPIGFDSKENRDAAFWALEDAGIECRRLFSCLPLEQAFNTHSYYWPGDYPAAEDIGNMFLYLPCHQNMSEGDVRFIVKNVHSRF
jgi:perosamine synthetase